MRHHSHFHRGHGRRPDSGSKPRRCPQCNLYLRDGSDVCPNCLSKTRVLLRIFTRLRPYWLETVFVWVLLFISTALNLVPPYLSKPLIDKALSDSNGSETVESRLTLLAWLVACLFSSRAIGVVISILRGRTIVRISSRISHDLRNEVFARIQEHSIRFFDRRRTGDLMSRVSNDTASLERVIIEGVENIVVEILTVIGIGIVLLVMNWKLALLVALPVPFVIIASRLVWKRLMLFFRQYWAMRGKFGAAINDTLSGIRVVKAFAKEQDEINRFNAVSGRLRDVSAQAERSSVSFMPALAFAAGCGTFIIWYVGGRDVVFGKMTTGTLMAFLSYTAMFMGPLQHLTRVSEWFARSMTAAQRVFEIVDTPPDVPESLNPVHMPDIVGHVEFANVFFGYDKNKTVLEDISLKAGPGEMIGLVGHSGAGKSTLINLLCRFYDPDSGSLLIDGINAKDIAQRDLRNKLGVVLQETFLFNASIAENIAFSKPDAPLEAIIAAAKTAFAHEFIMRKPFAYDTRIGERGTALSGGERQRIAIARAILHNPRILILDEATSSVDADTEQAIQSAIANLVKGRTTFAIAHRLSTLRNATRLIVLKQGRIIETGTHDELLEKQGEFYRLVQLHKQISDINRL